MTVRELIYKLINDRDINWDRRVEVYDPTADGYVELTGLMVLEDGAVRMQTPD